MNIRDTVGDALQKQGVPLSPQYRGYVDGVVTALETRESEIVSNLTLFAVEQGLSREDARSAMADCGLDVPQPTPGPYDTPPLQPQVVDPGPSVDPRFAAMEQQLQEMQATLRQMRG